jgi:hypothetical protein
MIHANLIRKRQDFFDHLPGHGIHIGLVTLFGCHKGHKTLGSFALSAGLFQLT